MAELPTRADGGDVDRVADTLRRTEPAVVVAAGGDGTVSQVVQALMQVGSPTPTLAILPFGTANTVARSLGLSFRRRDGRRAVDMALAVASTGRERRIDLGKVGQIYFVGSFALGMDADILRSRNRYASHPSVPVFVQGYPAYLWSCAVNLLRSHGGRARIRLDEERFTGRAYNLLVTNVGLYAGEFRFESRDLIDDGRLEGHVFTGPVDYVRHYAFAWGRHLRHRNGRSPRSSRRVRHVRRVVADFDAPVSAQLDGEEAEPMQSCVVEVVPQALRVRVPPASGLASTSGFCKVLGAV